MYIVHTRRIVRVFIFIFLFMFIESFQEELLSNEYMINVTMTNEFRGAAEKFVDFAPFGALIPRETSVCRKCRL